MSASADSPQGLVDWRDVRRAAGLVGGAAVSLPWPQRWDPALVTLLERPTWRLRPGLVSGIADKMRRALPPDPAFDPDRTARDFLRMFLEDAWGRSRGLRRHGWRPQVRIEGMERLDAALQRGRGAILWSLRFASATAIKQAFYHAGRPLVHLSRAEHGSATMTKAGVGVVAPLYCRAENPYLAERVVIPLNRSPRYLKTLRERLGDNAVVSIFAEHTGRQNVSARVLTADLEFAVGAPSLAWTEDAALLTVSAHREGPFQYRVEIGEEIPVDRAQPRKDFASGAVAVLARRLETLIVRSPADWQGWMLRDFPEMRQRAPE